MKASLLVSSSSRRRQEDDILVKEPFSPSWIQLEGILVSMYFDFEPVLLDCLEEIYCFVFWAIWGHVRTFGVMKSHFGDILGHLRDVLGHLGDPLGL